MNFFLKSYLMPIAVSLGALRTCFSEDTVGPVVNIGYRYNMFAHIETSKT